MNYIYQTELILCEKYRLSTQLINKLINEYKLTFAEDVFKDYFKVKTTPSNIKLRLLLHTFGSELFHNSKDLKDKIISKWEVKVIEASYSKYKPKEPTNKLTTKIRKLVNRKWTFDWAKEFILNSGLPIELAGIERKKIKLANYEDISPYIKLPELVDYQIKLKKDLSAVIREKGDDAKCIITLPTGAGKTRIAVDAYLDYLRPRFSEGKYLIWIAQSEELCEQAIKSFQDVWKSKEFTENLRIFRFYGDYKPDIEDLEIGGVVVCGIQKLHNSYDNEAFKHIVENCGTCIIDEAHRAVTMMYEKFYDYAESVRGEKIFPICGLTATPGRNDNPNKLPTRFKYNIFKPTIPDIYANNPIHYFRDNGFLARPFHDTIPTGSKYDFNIKDIDDKISDYDLREVLDYEIRNTGCKKLAEDNQRNRKILEKLLEIHDKSTIVYACSVNHAYNLNAMLTAFNIKSVVISGKTPRYERLKNIDKFKKGEINFIINHSVLTTGFDAPKTDNIVICRPIFSDILYEQIVGRGLRGPRFGGTEYCNIIDFTDNFDRFGDQQSYTRFEDFWDKTR